MSTPRSGDVLCRRAGDHHHRREEAQQLLDGGRDERRVVDELAAPFGVGDEVGDHAVERGGDGVEPAEQQQVAHAEQLLLGERPAAEVGVDDERQQRVVGIATPLGDGTAEVVADGAPGLLADPLRALDVARLDVGPDRVVAPLEELGQVVRRETHQREEDARRERRGQLGVEVARAPPGEPVEQLAHEPAHLRLECGDGPGREARVQDPPVVGVDRRIDLERQQRLFAELEAAGRGEGVGMPQGPLDVVVAADHGDRHAPQVAAGDGALGPQAGVGRVRVVRDSRLEEPDHDLAVVGPLLGGIGHGFLPRGAGGHRTQRTVPHRQRCRAGSCRSAVVRGTRRALANPARCVAELSWEPIVRSMAEHEHASRTIERHCDVAVVGGSAAGLAAALQLGRQRRSVIVVDAGEPRNAPAAHMHSYLGHEGAPPSTIVALGREEVRSYGGEVLAGRVVDVTRADDGRFRVELGGRSHGDRPAGARSHRPRRRAPRHRRRRRALGWRRDPLPVLPRLRGS